MKQILKLSIALLLTAGLLLPLGCKSRKKAEEVKSEKPNVLVDYIQNPKDKAHGAVADVEAVDKEVQRQLDMLDQ